MKFFNVSDADEDVHGGPSDYTNGPLTATPSVPFNGGERFFGEDFNVEQIRGEWVEEEEADNWILVLFFLHLC